MHTDPDRRSGQRRPLRAVSGVAAAVCLLVAVLFERRRRASRAPATTIYDAPTYSPTTPPAPPSPPVHAWPSSAPVDEPVWEDVSAPVASGWPVDLAEPEIEHVEVEAAQPDAEVALESGESEVAAVDAQVEPEIEAVEPDVETVEAEAQPEVEAFEAEIETTPEIETEPETEPESVEQPEQPAAAGDHWFGSFAPATPWQPPSEVEHTPDREADTDEYDAVTEAVDSGSDSVIELPTQRDETDASTRIRRLPPARLRRFMGTGATVLVIGLVLGAGVLVSGATADSSSDPATVPDAVGTTVADLTTDTTATDTTATDTTATDTTATDTTTTDTTAADTTATDTSVADTTTVPTTTIDTTTTSTDPSTVDTTTVSTDPSTVDTTSTDTTTTDTTPVAPPPTTTAPDPAASAPPAPAAPVVDQTPAVTPPPTTSTPSTPTSTTPKVKHRVRPSRHAPKKPVKATHATPSSDAPSTDGAPVVTLRSGADPIGSILSNTAIPAVDASLLPTPAQVSFYVQAAKPLSPLPALGRIDHGVAQRLVTAGRHGNVAWTVLAAVSRLESNFGAHSALIAGQHLSTTPTGDGLGALASYLHEHGAVRDPLAPAKSRKALTLYFGSTRKADRAIALAALYGALGPFGMQHGVRAETARLQRRVLADHRVHLTKSGRGDIRHGRVDPRVLVTLEYLANSFHKVGVSDLVSGGQLFSRSGSVSAHLYGRAADVASLHGKLVKGHQGPGTMTEQAIRKLLLLPRTLRPRQVISLMDVDGPTGNRGSFALPDHYNRIQIDY